MRRALDRRPVLIQKQRTSWRIGQGNGVPVYGRSIGEDPEKREQKYLGRHWSEWFDGLENTNMWKDEALLPAEIVDQAALHGVLLKAREEGESK